MKKTDELAKALAQNATTLEELNHVMRSLMKSTLERVLNTEMDVHCKRRREIVALGGRKVQRPA
jgi:transposase-like protein